MVELGSGPSCGPRRACEAQQQTYGHPQARSCGWPPENACQEWNLEQTLQSTIPRSEEPEALDIRTTDSLSWDGLWAMQPGEQNGEGLALSRFLRSPWPSPCHPTSKEPEKTSRPSLSPASLPSFWGAVLLQNRARELQLSRQDKSYFGKEPSCCQGF